MSHEIESYVNLLEQRLSLLRLLAQELVDSRKEFVALDLDGMYRHISQQEDLCRQIQRLHPAIHALHRTCVTQLGLGVRASSGKSDHAELIQRLNEIMQESGKARADVEQLNQIHAAYLRRSRKTINLLLNFFGSYAMTYGRPIQLAGTASTVTVKG